MATRLKSSTGVLLLDAKLRLVHLTSEAASILEYPNTTPTRESAVSIEKLLPCVRAQLPGGAAKAATAKYEFISGRRRYSCRAFMLGGESGKARGSDSAQPSIVVLLERAFPQAPEIAHWCESFQLTARECETVKYVLKGLTTKEIAAQMHISPKTVKSFLKLVMTKTGASNRMGIIAKVLGKVS